MGRPGKQSKRQPAKIKYKIEKKVREHNRKVRKTNKKKGKSLKSKLVQIPNICPFKEDILKDVEAMKKHKEEERQKHREIAIQQRASKMAAGLEAMVSSAESREKTFTALAGAISDSSDNKYGVDKKQENSLKAYYKEFKKVLEAADVILEVVDARDPLGTRCIQVEEAVRLGNKKLVLVLNKADLVPRANLESWLKYLRCTVPAVAFKASTQSQNNRLGHRKMAATTNDKAMQGSTCVGAELLMSLLANYCRNKGIKTSIRVGVVGLPNVGKSSIINSLKRNRACNVGATPGVTKQMQEVLIDSKIKLLDSPGVVFAAGAHAKDSDNAVALKNAISIGALKDPFTPANAILQRANKTLLCELYDVVDFSTPQEFYALKAARMGRFKKGGVPDQLAAARSLLEDWNHGKIKYYTEPPEAGLDVHLSAKIMASDEAKEFDIESFGSMETQALGQFGFPEEADSSKAILLKSSGPVQAEKVPEDDDPMDEDDIDGEEHKTSLLTDNIQVVANDTGNRKETSKKLEKKHKLEPRKKKTDPLFELDGNKKLNKLKKVQFKKLKKESARRVKETIKLAGVLENVTLSNASENYNFETDFSTK